LLDTDNPKSSVLACKTKNAFFQEGGPGTGKSTGFLYFLLQSIKINHPEVFAKRKTITIVHVTKESAENLAIKLGLTPGVDVLCYGKEEFFSNICPKYTAIHAAEKSDDGIYITPEDSVVEDLNTGIVTYPDWEVRDDLEEDALSNITIFDECTRMTAMESALFDKYLERYNSIGLKTGDFH